MTRNLDAAASAEAELIEAHFDLVEKATRYAMKKWQLPGSLRDEVTSGAQLALVTAARRAVGTENPSKYLFWAAVNGTIEALRSEWGRETLSQEYRNVKRPMLLADEAWAAVAPVDTSPDPCEQLIAREALREILDGCHDDRLREVVLRRAAGETQLEIAERFGISECRVSQLLSRQKAKAEKRSHDGTSDG